MKSKHFSKNNTIIKRNIGIEILRMFLCFRIILLHYYSSNNKYIIKIRNNQYQVCCFFLISFYFFYQIICKRNIEKMKSRLERLFIPYILYPIIIWIINNIVFMLIKCNRYNRLLTLKELKIHLIVGKGIKGMGVLWFQFNLLLFNIIFFIFSVLLKNSFLLFFQIIALVSFVIQYSRINYYFFQQYIFCKNLLDGWKFN